MKQMKDAIDFGKQDIPSLFRKMLLPTVLGMLFSAVFFITDGIFVGRGIGSNALAAINFVSPLNLISAGLGLMFGTGASVVASIHLAAGKIKAASINMTQSTVFFSIVMGLFSLFILLFPESVLNIMGCNDVTLRALGVDYIRGYGWFMIFNGFLLQGGFFLRLNGAPKYAMKCSIVSAVLNIFLDYLFIFPLDMGIFGAAIATGIGTTVGVAMMIIYLVKDSTKVHYIKVKFSKKSLKLTLRNIGCMSKLGISSFLGHFSVACMIVSGNLVFIKLLGAEGVAAYSIIGYISPLIFTVYNAVSLSAQPIVSYNYGSGDNLRVRKTLKVALATAMGYGLFATCIILFCSPFIASLFIAKDDPAYALAVFGLPFYSMSMIPTAFNLVSMGYFQSVEQAGNASIITLMRGYVLMIGCYAVLPRLFGVVGAWISTPLAECLTSVVVLVLHLLNRRRS